MNDTTPEFDRMYPQRLMALSGETRLKMGAAMFDCAVILLRAGIADQNDHVLTEIEVREQILERLHGDEFSPEVRRRVEPCAARALGDWLERAAACRWVSFGGLILYLT